MAGVGWLWSSLLVLCIFVAPSCQVSVGQLQVRLMNGSSTSEGRVEVRRFSNESWGTVCSFRWGTVDAVVVCRQLGFKWGQTAYFPRGSGHIYLSDTDCRGNETNLGQCQTSAWNSPHPYCSHYWDAGVKCGRNTVRISPQYGRFTVAPYGAVQVWNATSFTWMTVCDSSWDDNDAKVICKSVGKFDGKALCCGRLTRGSRFYGGRGSLRNIGCSGSESSFEHCTYTYSTSRCVPSPGLASVICYDQSKEAVDKTFAVRLANTSSTVWGRVEVKHLGVWGSVSAGNSWNNSTASIACRQATANIGGVRFGTPSSDVFQGSAWITQLNCSGNESSLEDCVVPPWGNATAYYRSQYALCYANSAPVVELVGGSDSSYGRVEIVMDGNRYTVCHKYWSTRDAMVVCRSLGYANGQAIKSSHYGQGSGAVALNGMRCYGNEDNLLRCRSYGWLQSSAQCNTHSIDASVACHGQVMLKYGDHNNGIVYVTTGGRTATICGTGFDDVDAGVVCKDLGYLHGRKLPTGSYGNVYARSWGWTQMGCLGNESSIYDCTHTTSYCYNRYSNYAAVHCYNDTAVTTSTVSLTGGMGDYSNSSGIVRFYQNGVRGKVCSTYWDDRDARVLCKQLGYRNGTVYRLSTPVAGPYLLSEINCVGTENSIFNCPVGNATCSSSYSFYATDAGAFCFNDAPPQVQLVGSSSDKEGRVEMVAGDTSGTVCISSTYQSYNAAKIICRSLGYATGYAKSVHGGTGRVALASVSCRGIEQSLLACRSNGFMAPPPDRCNSHTYDLGVTCQDEVELVRDNKQTNDTITGVVQLYRNNRWNYVCGTFFDDVDAGVVCTKMGYGYSKVLPSGAFGRIYFRYNVVGGVNCTGRETSLGSCPLQDGGCNNGNYSNYASVLCSKIAIPQGVRAVPPATQPGEVVIEVDGVHSRLCSSQWDNNDAKVYCRDLGYNYGRKFGNIMSQTSYPRLISNITCTGSENNIGACPFFTGAINYRSCNSYSVARVFCYNSQQDFQVRLVGSQVRHEGNVEIGINGQWGSVCDHSNARWGWTGTDANVACRSLGFVGGNRVNPGTYGSATSPTLIIDPSCQGSEDSITACDSYYFNNSRMAKAFTCSSTPASVQCTGFVKLTPNATHGGLQMMVNPNTSTYGFVCADGFGSQEATVACRDLGFPYGLHMSASAFGYISNPGIRRTNLHCTGMEATLNECTYSDSMDYCPSRKYASVVCSTSSPSSGYRTIVQTVQNFPYGRIKVQHMGYWGYICPDKFDNNAAAVTCREAGYAGGISYWYRNYRSQPFGDIRWLRDLQCAGTETYLTRCHNVVWGNITGCYNYGDAAVFCYRNTAPHFRLVNGTGSMGRLELWSEDMQGTVCSRYWDDREATVACSSMGFNGGRYLGAGVFGQGTGDVMVDYALCVGTESSLFDCGMHLKGTPGYAFCNDHSYDASIQCFNTTRITGSRLSTYGRVDVLSNGTWVAVCDQGFDTNAAIVVCRAVGYSYGRPQCCSALGPLVSYSHSLTARKIGAKINHCDGSESSLVNCDISLTDTCSSGKYASVLCSNSPIHEQRLQTRLVDTVYGLSRNYVGGVQVNRYGFWGPVCNSSWDDRDANATCHGLGYNYGISFYGRDRTGKPMVMGNFQCTGREASLADCHFGDIDDDLNCSLPMYNYQRKDAGALCFNVPGLGLKLVGGNSRWGRVEIQFEGVWGRVTDYYWSNTDATIACKQLGYQSGRTPPYGMRINHPVRSSKTWMYNVRCYGNEKTLFDCFNYWDYHSYYARDANVVCNNNVRLSRGNYVYMGVVEVNMNNNWGAVCDNQWSERNTQVTCKNLGYDNGYYLCCGAFGRTSHPMMETVSCSSSDTDLTACSHEVPGKAWCSANNVAVACYNGSAPTAYTYTLAGSPGNNNTGEVTIEFMNVTGRICSDGWDDNDAKVFCRELGFEYGKAYEHFLFNSYYYYSSTGPFWTTNVNCQGTESRLRDCQFTLGTVSQCQSGKAAGVLCTSIEGIFYRIGGSNSENKGRVEVAVDGQWGTVCRSYFSSVEATVFCRSLGFNDGTMDYRTSYSNPPNKIYQANLMCTGNENSLAECAHTGWKTATSYYCSHSRDASVICYDDVRIGRAYDPAIRQGPVQFYRNGTWYSLCDTGFDDVTAKRVCQDLEFVDGKAVVGSAYGSAYYYLFYYAIHLNVSMHCEGNEQSSAECLKSITNCVSGTYASVVCFRANDFVDENTYSFDFVDSSKRSGVVAVTHMNVTGRICNNDWDDVDARVLCKSKGHLDGIAFHYSSRNYATFSSRGPFWVSSMNCTGSETSLKDCPFKDRLHLGNCSKADLAGALCFNDSGIQYRISSDVPKSSEGRVEISVGGVWGTVCRYYWGDRDATVFCRSQGYSEGYSIRNTFGTTGSGPMWLSGLRCKGTESTLHQCPHSGFSDTPIEDGHYSYGCSSHSNDAYVSCVDKLKLNLGYKASMGAVMVYRQNKWNLICDSGFDHSDAQVVCRQQGYQFGTFLQGSMFGKVDAKISITNVRCRGTEADFSTCNFDISSACRSQKYASVFCSNNPIVTETENVRLARDNANDPRHGYLEYQVNGVWGAVCADTMDTNSVSVACKQLGFTGGQLYRPRIRKYQKPILTTDLKCKGTETRLDACPRATAPASAWCDYYAPRAGVLCYNDTDGISYRVTGDQSDPSRGRFEMKYMGQYGVICAYYNDNPAARVACKSVGYKDGLAIHGYKYRTVNEPMWLTNPICKGNESTIAECWSYGFNVSYWWLDRYCQSTYGPFSVQCYQNELAITDVRIVDGDTNSSGRVEVFLQGPDQWGTVCDDLWNDVDATVVCNQLGFATGEAVNRARFGQGSGRIWMDNVGCKGTETRLQDCGFNGFNVHNCLHSEDAGVICRGVYVPPTTSTVKPTKTMKPAQTTTSSSGGKTNSPGKQTQTGSKSSSKTAAIVVPIVVIIVIAIAAVVGFVLYRRRQRDNPLYALDEGGSSSGRVSFGQGGVVRFMNRMKGRGKDERGTELPGISNPGYESQGVSNPSYESAAGVFSSDHADFNSDA